MPDLSVLPSLRLAPEDESVRLLSHVLEDLDYTKLYQTYSAKGRNPVVDPKTLFKILTYAYSQSIYSSRKIEKVVSLLNHEYMKEFILTKENRTKELQQIFDFIDNYCKEHQIEFVHRKGKRKSAHQKFHELIRRFLGHQLLYDLHNSKFNDRNSYSKTNVDATFMHMKDNHMRNAQLKPGYNVQIGVDSKYIVAADIFSDRNDVNKQIKVSKKFINLRQESYDNITSDTGIKYRMNRSIQVEGAFGVLKNDYELQRFLLLGKTRVKPA